MNPEDPFYMGDDEDSAEVEDMSDIEAYQLHLLEVLKSGEYGVTPYVDQGELLRVDEVEPGFNKVKLQWDLTDCIYDYPIVNVQVTVEDEIIEYDAVTDDWIMPESGDEIIDELYKWLVDNIDNEIYDGKKAVTSTITLEDEMLEYMPLFDYYDVDGQLYYYFPEEDDDVEWTDEERERAKEMMAKAKPIGQIEAAQRVMAGDFELLPTIQ